MLPDISEQQEMIKINQWAEVVQKISRSQYNVEPMTQFLKEAV
jgi:hypothetical protein